MNRLIVIVGLPASGKTHWGENYAKENGMLFLDEPSSIKELNESLKTWDCVCTAPEACITGLREKIRERYPQVEFIYFENNKEQCLENAKSRPEKKVNHFIECDSPKYIIPEGATIIPVWRPQ